FRNSPNHEESKPTLCTSEIGCSGMTPLHPIDTSGDPSWTMPSLQLENELLELALSQGEALGGLLVLFLGAKDVRRLGIRARRLGRWEFLGIQVIRDRVAADGCRRGRHILQRDIDGARCVDALRYEGQAVQPRDRSVGAVDDEHARAAL